MSLSLPIHRLHSLHGSTAVVAAYGNKFFVIDSSSGKVLVAPASKASLPGTEGANLIADDDFPNGNIRSIAFHPQTKRLAVTSENKDLVCWDVATWKRLSRRVTIKRANCVAFNGDGSKLLIGDKFGDVYSFQSNDSADKEALILGHVSMLTDMALSHDGQYLLTADRDEKVRVSRYPLAFDILQFCLGHNDFISSIHIPSFAPNLLISGGGDPFLLTWDWMTGKIIQKIELSVPQDNPFIFVVTSITSHPLSSLFVVTLELVNQVLIFDASNPEDVKEVQKLDVADEPLNVAFDSEGKLWIAIGLLSEGPVLAVASRGANGLYAIDGTSEALAANLNKLGTESVDELPDYHPTSKLRKAAGHPPHKHDKRKKKGDTSNGPAKKKKGKA
ncbi:WD40-repeat-containing domain protein [Fimicolochytrium jonesii]|uniref:WD40-repeat-containing domain protein n=1 Tax=Fimicolochytrium jonesii TaxID=1396493 RepID=UPI0022FEA329|nr:WD40-repeat-containing domain protein [Fimicolochytrium jonesii]KAI8817955.1 WD40-repeat-containing domain protein [Fimicolochytrium jonesii]